MEFLKLIYPDMKKKKKWLREKQNATFADWLKERVSCEETHFTSLMILKLFCNWYIFLLAGCK